MSLNTRIGIKYMLPKGYIQKGGFLYVEINLYFIITASRQRTALLVH